MKLIDIHSHLQFPQFDSDRAAVIRRAREAALGIINVGTDLTTSRQTIALAEANDEMWATVGIHPTDIPPRAEEEKIFTELEKLARHERVVGIGECGLDNLKLKTPSEKEQQKEIFVRQIHLANEVKKPLMLHLRGSDVYREAYEILKEESHVCGNSHFFAGSWDEAKLFLHLGFTLSFTGVITFTNQYDEIVKQAPLGQIMAETDCPFVAPTPHRGRRNEPIYVIEVIKRIAELRGLSFEVAANVSLTNARRVFISPRS